MPSQPRIKRRLRFFEQRHFGKPRRLRRPHRQLARDFVKRRRHRDQQLFAPRERMARCWRPMRRVLDAAAEASTGLTFTTGRDRRWVPQTAKSAGATTPSYASHDLADDTSRIGTCPVRARQFTTTTKLRSCPPGHGRSSDRDGKSSRLRGTETTAEAVGLQPGPARPPGAPQTASAPARDRHLTARWYPGTPAPNGGGAKVDADDVTTLGAHPAISTSAGQMTLGS